MLDTIATYIKKKGNLVLILPFDFLFVYFH